MKLVFRHGLFCLPKSLMLRKYEEAVEKNISICKTVKILWKYGRNCVKITKITRNRKNEVISDNDIFMLVKYKKTS